MGHAAQQKLGEEHSLDAVVFGEFRRARHLGNQIGSRVVLPNEFHVVGHDQALRVGSTHQRERESCSKAPTILLALTAYRAKDFRAGR